MDFLFRADRRDGIQRRHHAEPAVIVEADIAVVVIGILPRDHEDGMAAIDQIFHQRVLRRQVEDVVFHDPGRSEEHTSELQSLMRISYAVFCLKKKKHNNKSHEYTLKQYMRD